MQCIGRSENWINTHVIMPEQVDPIIYITQLTLSRMWF